MEQEKIHEIYAQLVGVCLACAFIGYGLAGAIIAQWGVFPIRAAKPTRKARERLRRSLDQWDAYDAAGRKPPAGGAPQ